MKLNPNVTAALAASIALATPAWADVVPISDPGGPYGVLSAGSLSLDGSGSLPSDGQSITNYDWDLDNDGDYDELISGANPAAIAYATLTGTYGLVSGPNTIKLRVTDDAALSTTAEATVYLDGAVYIGGTSTNDTWTSTSSWDTAAIPTGTTDVIIPAGKQATARSAGVLTYDGDLSLGNNSTLLIGYSGGEIPNAWNSLGTAGTTTITMGSGAHIRSRNRGSIIFPAIALQGDARISLGDSTETPTNATFNYPITGAHTFTLQSNNAPTVPLNVANSCDGFVIEALGTRGGSAFTVQAKLAGSLGVGDVTILPYTDNKAPKLELDVSGAIAATATLNINGGGPAGDGANRLQMDADNTVDFLNVGGFAYPAGTYGRIGSPGTPTNEMAWIAGDSVLTVTSSPVDTDAPVLSSITDPVSAFTTNLYVGDTVTFTLTFDEVVSSTSTTADFENAETVGAATVTIDSVIQTDVNKFQVVVTATGTGAFRLGAKGSASFDDLFGNTLNGPFTDDTTFTVLAGPAPTLTISGVAGGADSWNTGANWDSGFPPFSTYPAAVATGVIAEASNAATQAYSGGLTLESGSSLYINNVTGSQNALGTGPITFEGATVRLTIGVNPLNFPALVLDGNASFTASGNTEDNKTRNFPGVISGTGLFTYSMRRGTTVSLTGSNTSWSGGFVANNTDPVTTNFSRVRPDNDGFGTGDVTLNDGVSLEILSGRGDTIDDGAALFVNGRGRTDIRKLKLDSNETVGEFWLDGVQKAAGDYDSTSGLVDTATNPLISGSGTLTVLSGPGGGTTYATWSGGAAADIDSNGDGVQNAVAYALGAANVSENAIGLLPTLDNTSDPTYVIFTFNRSDEAEADGTTAISVEYGNDLVDWTTAVDDNDNVEIEVTDSSPTDTVVVKLKRSTLGSSGKLFARLNVVVTP